MRVITDPALTLITEHPTVPAGIKSAIDKCSGARFYKCALQVNPFSYLQRHQKQHSWQSEGEYNSSIVKACIMEGIEVVAITDHFRISNSHSLAELLNANGIYVFNGFEACSSEGVHILCIFSRDITEDKLQSFIGACGVTDFTEPSPQSSRTCKDLLELIKSLGGVTIAAHVCSASGLLTALHGQSRARVWTCDDLLAVALPGPRENVPQQFRNILLNKEPEYQRERPVAVLNANDVSDPQTLSDPSATTFIKMVDVTVEGLRQAFLDPESRVRLHTDPSPGSRMELVGVCWMGGLFDGQCVRLNEGLNVLIGGRGSGKSTLIESLRYALDVAPKGIEAKRMHESIIKYVLGGGSSVSVLVRSPRPAPQYYIIERLYNSQSRVRGHDGDLIQALTPHGVLGNIEIYGQHEISELTREPEKLAQLLRRFTSGNSASDAKNEHSRNLERSRSAVLEVHRELRRIEETLSVLPVLQEKLRRFAEAGLDVTLNHKTQIDRESRVLTSADQMVEGVGELANGVANRSAFGDPLVASDGAGALPNANILLPLNTIQNQLRRRIERAARYIAAAKEAAAQEVAAVKAAWEPKEREAADEYQRLLRELKAQGQDGTQYVAPRTQVDQLGPKEEERTRMQDRLQELGKERQRLLTEWDNIKAQDFRELQRAARKVSQRLEGRVRVSVRQSRHLGHLEEVLRRHCTGNYAQALERLRSREDLSVSDLAEAITEDTQKLVAGYGFTKAAAEKIVAGGLALKLEIEECEIPTEAILELNVGSDETPVWKQLDQLSTGQKATAVLLLLLLEADAPLIIDQPEDDLDNHFISDCIVQVMRAEKKKRQFLFSSHNANIPVLGDAEQIIGLQSVIQDGVEKATIPPEWCGSIDKPTVKVLVKNLLEGGQAAFEYRRKKYGF